MAIIKIDGQDFDSEKLSDEVKAQLASIQAVDLKIEELKRDTAIVMTARNMYIQALKSSLPELKAVEDVSEKTTKKK